MESDEVERFKHCTVTRLFFFFFGNCTLLISCSCLDGFHGDRPVVKQSNGPASSQPMSSHLWPLLPRCAQQRWHECDLVSGFFRPIALNWQGSSLLRENALIGCSAKQIRAGKMKWEQQRESSGWNRKSTYSRLLVWFISSSITLFYITEDLFDDGTF